MRGNIIEYGEAEGRECPSCGKCTGYRLSVDYNYTKFLTLTLFERRHKYFLKCKGCGIYTQISDAEAGSLIERNFEGFERKRKRSILTINILSILLAAATMLGAVWLIINTGDGRFKNLVADQSDGYYEIYDSTGEIWAAISKQGSARYSLLVKRETILAEDYDDVEEDIIFEHYYFEQENGLKYIRDNAAAMADRFGVGIRYYFYDPDEDDIFYYFGVDDMGEIEYSQYRVIYPMTLYSDTAEEYTKVCAISERYKAVLLLGSSLEWVKLITLDGGRETKYEYFDFSAGNSGFESITEATGADAIAKLLRDRGIEPSYSEDYLYYRDTNVREGVFITALDPGTGKKITKQLNYAVEEKGAYYIVRPDADIYLPGEKVAIGNNG